MTEVVSSDMANVVEPESGPGPSHQVIGHIMTVEKITFQAGKRRTRWHALYKAS